MTDAVRFDPMWKVYMRGSTRLSGLLELMKARFYPHYSFTKATFNRVRSETEHAERSRNRSATASGQRRRGFDTGIKLDKEITATVDMTLLDSKLNPVIFYNTAARAADTHASTGVKQTCADLMQQTRRFWHTCQVRRLKPYATQFIVSSGSVAHALDVLARDEDGNTWIIEVKSGYEGYMSACTKQRMRFPLHAHTDSKENQHQLQLAAQRKMFTQQHPTVIIGGCMVLHLHARGVTEYALKPWAAGVKDWVALLRDDESNAKRQRVAQAAV